MNYISKVLVVALLPLMLLASAPADSQAGLGLGVHYLNTVGDMKDHAEFESGALGFLASYNMGVSLIHFEANLEWVPDYAYGYDMIQPQAFALIGTFIYGGVGIGIGHINGQWQDSPFYALRAGLKFSKLDIFTSFRFQYWDTVENLNSRNVDALTLGAIFRF